jgi:hypothetical protein
MTTSSDSTDLLIKKNEYVAFDALSLKEFIRNRLTESGLFTDQNFEGSNLNAINNIVAYSFHTLMYYLNQTSTESMFSEAQLYENMNRIVKLINYSPVGAQTSTLSFTVSSTNNLATGTYTIPRYSFIRAGGVQYSFNTDITFTVSTSAGQLLETVGDQYLLYQGIYIEYPLYVARGEPNEVMFLIPGENIIVDHFNIDIYVKSITTGVWTKWNRVDSLYLEDGTSEAFEIRLNENKNYEIKFGNDINGVQLTEGDAIAIYYLQSSGDSGQVGAATLDGQQGNLYTTAQFNTIKADVISPDLTLLTDVNIVDLEFANTNISTAYTDPETAESIRANAPASFRSQFRVVTSNDYESYLKSSFANIINDVKVLNNNSYVTEHLKYLYDIGLTNPGQDYRVLFNQARFADSCNFNNVYVYVLPKATKILTNNYVNYLTPAQKQLIVSTLNSKKTLTSEVIVMDPVYKAVTIGLGKDELTTADINQSQLVVVLDRTSKLPASVIKDNIRTILSSYFNPLTITLGFTVSIASINNSITGIAGVKRVFTRNSTETAQGVSMIVYNPSYPSEDIISTTKDFTVGNFQTVYLDDIDNIINRVVVETETTQDTTVINF